ncbi:MAG: hypothetical protein ACP5K8_00560 [Nitrososphaeria archaeon]
MKDLRVIIMGKMVIRYKIFPTDININLQTIYDEIKKKLAGLAEVGQFKTEPIAFGLSALILDIRVDDNVDMDFIESTIRESKNVSELEVVASTKV